MNGARLARIGTGVVAALLAVAIILLIVNGEDLKIPAAVYSASLLILPGLWTLLLKQGQAKTQQKLDQLLDQAEARGFERGVAWAKRQKDIT